MQTDVEIVRWEGEAQHEERDAVVVEEPLAIRVNGESLTVTMRTPGDDFALAAGFLLAEGIARSSRDIGLMGYGTDANDPERYNVLHVALANDWQPDKSDPYWQRNFVSSASCGVCGKADLGAIRCDAPPLENAGFRVPRPVFSGLNARMREAQQVFAKTGGLHAAALFDAAGNLIGLKEDIGRHNAVDKLLGAELMSGRLPLSERILMVSGRVSFEILQKAAMARAPILCAVSAPSSLAVTMARDLNMTLIGFLRGDAMNIYAGAERISTLTDEEATAR